jgi:hypothetical protein
LIKSRKRIQVIISKRKSETYILDTSTATASTALAETPENAKAPQTAEVEDAVIENFSQIEAQINQQLY